VYDGVNRLLRSESLSGITTYSYDAAGNRRSLETPSGDLTTYTWNGENQLAQVELPTGDVVTYVWDPVNKLSEERVVTRDDGVTQLTYLWDNNNVLRETDDVGTVEAEYTYQPEPYGDLVSQRRDADSRFYWFDALGSTTALTDDTGTVTDEARYQAFGQEVDSTGSTKTPYRWVGRIGYRRDETTGLFNLRARDYDSVPGRFLSQDSIGLASGDSNFYRYAMNNPVVLVDPSGKGPEWHHLLPQQVFSDYGSYIANLNINIHDAQWGWILPDTAHAQLHPAWNNEWANWFRSKIARGEAITLQAIRAKLASMLRDPRYARYLNQGVPANVSYFEWSNKVTDKVKHFNKLKKALAIILAVLAGCVAGAADAYAAFGPALELGSEEARREYATALAALQSGDYDTATKAMFGTEETCPFYEPNPKGLVCKLLAKTFQAQELSYNAVIRADAAARRKWSDAINKARQDSTSSCPTCPAY
jgi:RHS repeat-associated protein